jgi:hypothetical protein
MTEEKHENCKYNFWKWLIQYATKNKSIYWLLWGGVAALIVCAFRFGLVGIF